MHIFCIERCDEIANCRRAREWIMCVCATLSIFERETRAHIRAAKGVNDIGWNYAKYNSCSKEKLHCHGRGFKRYVCLFAFGIVGELKEQQHWVACRRPNWFLPSCILYVRVHAAHEWMEKTDLSKYVRHSPLAQVRSSSMEFFIVSPAVCMCFTYKWDP